ncbi:hypothetical protein [Antrihabitans spumae]|uniref:Uncharacterized protein n=1 Tax=Antrihabitans spumae TaxID=3373370 RepID=A0ABW7KS46_9NOCA
MVGVVTRLLTLLLLVLAVLIGTPVLAAAEPTPPAPSAPAEEPDLYSKCRAIGDKIDSLPGPLSIPAKQFELTCDVGTAVANPSDAVGEAMDGAVGEAATAFADGWTKAITMMFTWWYRTPLTDEGSSGNSGEIISEVHSYLRFFQIALFVVSIGVSAVRLAFARAEMRDTHAREAAAVLTRTVFASWSLAGLVVIADEASRRGGMWIVELMVGDNLVDAAKKLLISGPLLGPGLLFVFAFLGLIGTIVQCCFVLAQMAVAKLIQGVIPLAAAGSGFAAGKQAYNKLLAWTAVFLLFPLMASIVYGVAFAAAGGSDDAQGTFAGLILLTLSFLTLPALMRLIVPAVGSMGGASGMALAAGVMAATGSIGGRIGESLGSTGGATSESPSSPPAGGRSDGQQPTGATTSSGAAGSTGGIGSTGSAGATGAASSGGAASGGGAAASGAASGGATAAGPAGAAVMAGEQAGKAVGAVVGGVAGATGAAMGGPDTPDGDSTGGRSA